MAQNNTNVGKLLLVDPNPPGKGVVNPEDLFLYVKLTANSKSRSVIKNESGVEGGSVESDTNPNEVNFIATKLNDSSGDKVSYLTTDYTEIGGLGDANGNKDALLEGFGIDTINITYNASFVPQVKIKFIDIRGASLFDVIDKDNRESPYSMFFKMPYPTFQLTVKGYYGKPVRYCLHMLKWNSSFNASNGNFEIDADFVGYQGAFLSDIRVQDIIGVTNTQSGRERLNKLTIDDGRDNTVSTPPYASFLNEISRLQIDLSDIKVSSDVSDKLTSLNTISKMLNELLTLVGNPIPNDGNTVEGDTINAKKDPDVMYGSGILSNTFNKFKNLIPYRDLIIIKGSEEEAFSKFMDKAHTSYQLYDKYVKLDETNKKYKLKEFLFKEKSDDGKLFGNPISLGYFEYIVNNLYDEGTILFKLASDDTEYNPKNLSEGDDNTTELFLKRFEGRFKSETEVIVHDFTKMRNELKGLETKINIERDTLKERYVSEINKELAERLYVTPTMKNAMTVLLNNAQVLLEEIHSVAKEAEGYGTERYKKINTKTQTKPGDNIVYAFPDVYQYNEKTGENEQIWLGDINGINEVYFPEIKFIENVIDSYIKTSADIEEVNDVINNIDGVTKGNWVRINPLDINTNPYSKISGSKKSINELYNIAIERAMVLYGYSNVSNNTKFNNYGVVEGGVAAESITLAKNTKLAIRENFNSADAIKIAINEGVIVEEGDDYILKNTKLNNIFNLEKYQTPYNYLVGDDVPKYKKAKTILSENLEVKLEDQLNEINKTDKYNSDDGVFYVDNYLYTHNISYLVWGGSESYTITAALDALQNALYDAPSFIPGPKDDQTDYTLNLTDLPEGLKYDDDEIGTINSDTNEEKVKNILDKINFKPADVIIKKYIEIGDNEVNPKYYKKSKTVIFPLLYVVWVGLYGDDDSEFKRFAKEWVDSNGDDFINNYTEETDNRTEKLLTYLTKETDVIVTTPFVDKNVRIPKTQLKNYLNKFKTGYEKITEIKEEKKSEDYQKQSESTNNSSLKLVMYNNFKNLFDKWLGGTTDGRVYNDCSGGNGDLKDSFKFINSKWDDIGDKAACNLSSLVGLSKDTSLNLYLYISKILRDSNFLFQILPSYINFKNGDDVESMFKPITDVSEYNNDTSPTYVCIFTNSNSKVLEISDKETDFHYSNDALNFDFDGGNRDNSGETGDRLVAFRVAFGSQNQSIFTSVSLNQNENSPTGEYYKQLANLVDKRGKTQSVLQGNDLYDLFSTRSYKCGVTSLGNMNIQPLMMFQLDNVAFFRGAYQILSVEHSISPNHMETKFSGLRQSSYTIPVIEDATTYMNIDFNEVDNSFNKISKDIRREVLTIMEEFKDVAVIDPIVNFNMGLLLPVNLAAISKRKYVGNEDFFDALSKYMDKWFNPFGLITNSEVCIFLAQCLHESNNFRSHLEDIGEEKANANYGGRYGNVEEGDGYKYRGRGFKQITFKANYATLEESDGANTSTGNETAGSLFDGITTKSNEELDELFDLSDEDGIERSLVSALIFWKNNISNMDLNKGNIPTMVAVTKKVNGGYNGIERRVEKFVFVLENFRLKGNINKTAS